MEASATMDDVEAAIMKEDFEAAKYLAAQVLDFAVVQKDVGHEAKYYLGLSHLRLEEFSDAIEIFIGITKEGASAEIKDKAYLGLFDAYYQQAQYRKALKTAKKLLKKSPHSQFISLINLKAARASLKLSKWKLARKYLTEIIEHYPNSYEYHTAKQLLEEKQYFAVQVGAFVERERAEQVIQALMQKDEYAYIVETQDRKDTKFYRVRVGQFTVLKGAESMKTKLSQLGYPTRIYP